MPIRVTDYINVTSPIDTYATHLASLGKGGFRSVTGIAERDAITNARKEVGMWVNVVGDAVYEWDGTGWFQVTGIGSESIFSGVIRDNTLTGNGYTTLLGIAFSNDAGNIAVTGTDGKLYVPLTNSFSGVTVTNSITGDGYNDPLGIPVSTDLNNILVIGSDGRLYVPADSGSGNFTGVIVTDRISGDGYSIALDIPLSTGINNQLRYGPDNKLYVPTGVYFTGVKTTPAITGNGLNTSLGIPVSSDSNNQLRLGTDNRLYVPTGNYFTGVRSDNTIDGNGYTTDLTVPVSAQANNILTIGSDGRLYAPRESGNILSTYDEGILKSSNTASLNFVGGGVTASNIGDAITVTIPGASGAQTDIRYYYGNSELPFSDGTNSGFFANSGFHEDDPYSISDGTGILRIPRNGRYHIEFHGTITEADSEAIMQIKLNNSGIAFSIVDDPDTGIDTPFALFYEGSFSSGDLISFEYNNGVLKQAMIGLNEVITSSVFGGVISGSDIAVYDEGILLNSAATSFNFVGASIQATNVGQAITVSGIDQSYTGSITTEAITGDGKNTRLGIPLSTDVNNQLKYGSDNRLYVPTGDYFTGVRVASTITGNGKTIDLGVPLSTGVNNQLRLGPDGRLYVPTGTYFSGVSVLNPITGNGNTDPLGIRISNNANNQLRLGSDTGLFVPTGNYFTGVLVNQAVTGDGYQIPLGISISSGIGNIIVFSGGGLYAPTVDSFTGVSVVNPITGNGKTTNLGIRISADSNNLIQLRSNGLYALSGDYFTGVLTQNSITGDGKVTRLGIPVSADSGNILIIGTDGRLYAPTTSGIVVRDEGTILTNNVSSLNFVGGIVTATNSGNAVTVTINETGFFNGVTTNDTITGDGKNTLLGIPLSTGINNQLIIGPDGRLYVPTGNYFDGVSVNQAVTGDGYLIPLGVALSSGLNNILTYVSGGLYVPSIDSFTGVVTNNTITGNGDTTLLGIPLSSDANNQLKYGTDGRLHVPTGNYFTGVWVSGSLSGNGYSNPIFVTISNNANNQLRFGSDGKLYVPTGDYFTGVLVGSTITGNGKTTYLGVPISTGINNQLKLGPDNRLYVPTGNYFTGVISDNTIDGDGRTVNLTVPVSVQANNILTVGSDGRLYVPRESGNLLSTYDEGILKSNNTSSLNFIGGGVTATNIGDAITVTIPGASGAQTDIRYYYGNSDLTFSDSSSGFLANSGFHEDDPFNISNGTGILRIPRNGRYRVQFDGSITEADAPTTIQINVNGSGVAYSMVDDNDTGIDTPFALFYERDFASGDLISFEFNDGVLIQAMVGLNEVITSSVFGGVISGSDIAVYDEGVLLNPAATSFNFVGTSIQATNVGQAITVSGVDQSYTGSTTDNTINGNGFNVPLSVNISNNANNIVTTGTDGAIYVPATSGIIVQDEGSTITSNLSSINFVGGIVTATNIGNDITVTINETGIFTGVWTDFTITGNGLTTTLGVPLSTGLNNQLKFGPDGRLYVPTGTYFSGVIVNQAITGNGSNIPLGVAISTGINNLLVYSGGGLYVPTIDDFTGVRTNNTITGNGDTTLLGIPLSTGANNQLTYGSDGRLFVPTGTYFTGNLVTNPITGDGRNTHLGLRISNQANNLIQLTSSGVYALSGNWITGVSTNLPVTGNGVNIPVGVRISNNANNQLRLGSDTGLFVPTGNYFTGVNVNQAITGNGMGIPLGVSISSGSNNILTYISGGLYVPTIDSFTGVIVDTTISGDGKNYKLGIPLSTDINNQIRIGTDGKIYVPTGTYFTGVNVNQAITGNGSSIPLGIALSTGINNLLTYSGGGLYVPTIDDFTGVKTNNTITGNGDTTLLGIPLSVDSNNQLTFGSDGRLYVPTGAYFTGNLVINPITGDGKNTYLGLRISNQANNLIQLTNSGLYAFSGSWITGVSTNLPITGNGVTIPVGIRLSNNSNNQLILGSDSGLYVPTGNYFTGVRVTNPITGNGFTTNIGLSISNDGNNLIQLRGNGLYALSGDYFTGVRVDTTITGDGKITNLGVPISTGINNQLRLGPDNRLYVPTGAYFTGVNVNQAITGNGSTIPLGVSISTGNGNLLIFSGGGLYVPTIDDFTGVKTDNTLTGNGDTILLGVPLSINSNNQLRYGSDGRLFVPTGTYFTGVRTTNPITGNGLTTDLGIRLSNQVNNLIQLTSSGLYAFSGAWITSVNTSATITGNGVNIPLGVPLSTGVNNQLTLGPDGRLYVPTGNYFTGNLVTNPITGDGRNTFLGLRISNVANNLIQLTNSGIYALSGNWITGVSTNAPITGNGVNIPVGVRISSNANNQLRLGSDTGLFVPTGDYFTGVITNATITGNGKTTQLGIGFSINPNNAATTGTDGRLYVAQPSGSSVYTHYYYGKTNSSFAPSGQFFGNPNFIEEDPYSLRSGTGINIKQSGRYIVDVVGSLASAGMGASLLLLKNGSTVAETSLVDFGGDDFPAFAITYDGNLNSGEIISLANVNSKNYSDVMFRLREVSSAIAFYGSFTGYPLEVRNEGLTLTANASVLDFVGEGINATNAGNIVTVNVGSTFTGVIHDNTLTGDGKNFNLGVPLSANANNQLRYGSDGRLYVPTGTYFTGVRVSQSITGNGLNIDLGVPLSTGANNGLIYGSDGKLFAKNIANSNLQSNDDRYLDLNSNLLQIYNGSTYIIASGTATNGLGIFSGFQVIGDIFGILPSVTIDHSGINDIRIVGDQVALWPASPVGQTTLKFYDSSNEISGKYVGLTIPTGNLTNDITFVLPTGHGSSGNALVTDGSGNLSFRGMTSFTGVKTNVTITGDGLNSNLGIPLSTGLNNGLVYDSSDSRLYAKNFANANLSFSGNRTHSLNGNALEIAGGNGSMFFLPTAIRGLSLGTGVQILGALLSSSPQLQVSASNNIITLRSPEVHIYPLSSGLNTIFKFYNDDSTGNYIGFQAPTLTQNTTFILPTGDGNSGNVLLTDGNGNLSFGSVVSFTGVRTNATITGNGDTTELGIPVSVDVNNGLTFGVDSRLYSRNFANTNLSLNASRTHNLLDYPLSFVSGEFSVYSLVQRGLNITSTGLALGVLNTFPNINMIYNQSIIRVKSNALELYPSAASSGTQAIRFYNTGSSNYIGFKGPASISSNLTFVLPTGDGVSGQALVTDGGGNLNFRTVNSFTGVRTDSTLSGNGDTTLLGVSLSTGLNNGLVLGVDNRLYSRNFANTDLSFSGSRTHNLNGNTLQINGNNAFIYLLPTTLRGLILSSGTQTLGNLTPTSPSLAVSALNNTISLRSSGIDLWPLSNVNTTLKFYHNESTGYYIGFKAPSLTQDIIFTLPTGDGTSGQVLTTNGNGVLNFATSTSFNGVTVDNSTITGNGYTTALAVQKSADLNNILELRANGLYVPADSGSGDFSGVDVNLPITGDGYSVNLGIKISNNANNQLRLGSDTGLFVPTGNYFTGIRIINPITGDGLNTNVGLRLSSASNNLIQLTSTGLYAFSGAWITGVSTSPTITGNGVNISLGVPLSTGLNNQLRLGPDNRLWVPTGTYFTGNLVTNPITGNGLTTNLGIAISNDANNGLQLRANGLWASSGSFTGVKTDSTLGGDGLNTPLTVLTAGSSQNFANTNLTLNNNRTHELSGYNLTIWNDLNPNNSSRVIISTSGQIWGLDFKSDSAVNPSNYAQFGHGGTGPRIEVASNNYTSTEASGSIYLRAREINITNGSEAAGAEPVLKLFDKSAQRFVGFKVLEPLPYAPNTGITFILPTGYGVSGHVLTTNGQGTLYFAPASGGVGSFDGVDTNATLSGNGDTTLLGIAFSTGLYNGATTGIDQKLYVKHEYIDAERDLGLVPLRVSATTAIGLSNASKLNNYFATSNLDERKRSLVLPGEGYAISGTITIPAKTGFSIRCNGSTDLLGETEYNAGNIGGPASRLVRVDSGTGVIIEDNSCGLTVVGNLILEGEYESDRNTKVTYLENSANPRPLIGYWSRYIDNAGYAKGRQNIQGLVVIGCDVGVKFDDVNIDDSGDYIRFNGSIIQSYTSIMNRIGLKIDGFGASANNFGTYISDANDVAIEFGNDADTVGQEASLLSKFGQILIINDPLNSISSNRVIIRVRSARKSTGLLAIDSLIIDPKTDYVQLIDMPDNGNNRPVHINISNGHFASTNLLSIERSVLRGPVCVVLNNFYGLENEMFQTHSTANGTPNIIIRDSRFTEGNSPDDIVYPGPSTGSRNIRWYGCYDDLGTLIIDGDLTV